MRHVRLALVLGVVTGIGTLGCGATTVRSITPEGGATTLQIECIELDGCLSEAHKHCHGPYRTVSTKQNTITESDLPGLNARTQRQSESSSASVSAYGPGIESDEPMPLTQVVVVCAG